MTARSPHRPAGFTLIELMISILVSAMVVAAAVALLIGQQRLFQSSSADRALQDSARVALGELNDSLRMAGYGVDPGLAFDFGQLSNIVAPQAPMAGGATVRTLGYRCQANPVTCRDRIDGSDEIVFYSRDPYFGHRVASVGGTTTINISGPLNTPLYQGQVLQLMCTTGSMPWAYVTVGGYVAPSAGPGNVGVALAPGGAAALDFPNQNPSMVDPCFGDGTALVAKVDRYRYYVETRSPVGNVVPAQTAGSRPFLMLEQGLTDQNGAALFTAVAADVEDVQFSYLFPLSAVTQVGETVGAVIAAGAAGIDLGALGPGYGVDLADASRTTHHPANIRAVRVFVVVRPPTADITVPDAVVPAAANRPAVPGLPGYRRLVVSTTVVLPNLDARAPAFPTYSSNGGLDNLNFNGG
jgi:type IV pilus assembly protein PilW